MNDVPTLRPSVAAPGPFWKRWIVRGFCLVLAGLVVGPLYRPLPEPGPQGRASAAEQEPDFQEIVRRIDESFQARWQEAGLQAAPAAPLLTLARRLALGLAGTIPSLEEIRALERRERENAIPWWLTRLLEDRRSSSYLAERFARVLVGVEDGPFLIFRRHRLVDWLAGQIQANRPYDEVVQNLITARGIWTTQPEVNFVTVTVDQNNKENGPDEVRLAGRVARAFLGVRLDCVQCHRDYLHNRWRQQDFHGLAAFFAPAEMTLTGVQDRARFPYEFRFQGHAGKEAVAPAVPFEPTLLPIDGEPRSRLAAWVTHPGNKAFARATVNRVWAILFNRPLVEPVDDIPAEGPFPPALELLAEDWVKHGYDLHRLIRVIAATRAFQLDSAGAAEQEAVSPAHDRALASYPLTRLRPEQVAGSVLQAASLRTLGAETHVLFRIMGFFQRQEFIQRFGDRGEEELRPGNLTIAQRLQLMNGKLVRERSEENIVLNAPTRIAALAPDDAFALESIYLCALTRRPTAAESVHFQTALRGLEGKARRGVIEDIFWTLLNATEFSWNH